VGSYFFFAHHGMLESWSIFHSVTAWCGVAVLAWFLGLSFMLMSSNWSTKIDKSFQEKGFTISERIRIIWSLTLIPAILGSLFSLYTFLERPNPGEEYPAIRMIILLIGFVPVTLYGLARANQTTQNIVEERLISQQEPSDAFLRVKWWPINVLIVTYLLTPFFGASLTASHLRRLIPRYRVLIFVVMLLLGFFITLSIAPLSKPLKGFGKGDPRAHQALALYSTLALFTGVSYILLIKGVDYFRKRSE
jgi:hypothetical protein